MPNNVRFKNDEDWIKHCSNLFDNKYDYSLFERPTKRPYNVKIICPIHGEFEQNLISHADGKGCRKCYLESKKVPLEVVKERLVKAGQDISTIDFSTYAGVSSYVNVTCPTHGTYATKIRVLLKGARCKKCLSKAISRTQEEVISGLLEVYGDKYILDKVSYVNKRTKIILGCKTHGYWSASYSYATKGYGCPACAREGRFDTSEEVESKFSAIHGNKYDYSKMVYRHNKEKVEIVCPDHGSFWMKPNSHLNGHGCKECGRISKLKKDFEEEAGRKHNYKYTYEKAVYVQSSKHLEITCPTHGSFWMKPNVHLTRCSGCPSCAETGFDKLKSGALYVYTVRGASQDFVGYGISNYHKDRHRVHKNNLTRSGFTIESHYIISFNSGADALNLETELIKRFLSANIQVSGFRRESTHINKPLKII